MGAVIEDKFRMTVTHVFGMNLEYILQELDIKKLKNYKGVCTFTSFCTTFYFLTSSRRLDHSTYIG